MGYCGRILLLTTVATYLLSAPIVAAQSAPRKDAPAGTELQSEASGDHGLVLILSRDATPEPPDSPALKTCLDHNPSVACVPLILTIKNEGKETILSWSGGCGVAFAHFDLRRPAASWVAFPMDLENTWTCSSVVMGVESLRPGEVRFLHFKLADDSLMLGTAFPRSGEPMELHRGYALLTGSGPYTIRAHWSVRGCTASEKLKQGSQMDPFAGRSRCANGSVPQPHFVVLQSNELTLESESTH
jgi:hypothetical protein